MHLKPIQEFTDTQLIEELGCRFDDIVIAGRKVMEADKVERRRFWKGDMDACVGLVMGASQDCLSKNWNK